MEKKRKRLRGVVVSDKMDKSRVMQYSYIKKHPLYKKYIKKTKKYMYHDPQNKSHTGDMVMIEESRPISKRKKWVLVDIINMLETGGKI